MTQIPSIPRAIPRARRSTFEASGQFVRVRELRASYVALPTPGDAITSPAVIARVFADHFSLLRDVQENLIVGYVDAKNRLIGIERMFRGTVNMTTVSARDILRNALLLNAVGIVVGHNHPSGCSLESFDDVAFTRRLVDAGKLVGVDVLDHLVLGCAPDGSLQYSSLKARGVM